MGGVWGNISQYHSCTRNSPVLVIWRRAKDVQELVFHYVHNLNRKPAPLHLALYFISVYWSVHFISRMLYYVALEWSFGNMNSTHTQSRQLNLTSRPVWYKLQIGYLLDRCIYRIDCNIQAWGGLLLIQCQNVLKTVWYEKSKVNPSNIHKICATSNQDILCHVFDHSLCYYPGNMAQIHPLQDRWMEVTSITMHGKIYGLSKTSILSAWWWQ